MNKFVKLLLVVTIAVNACWLFGVAAGWFSFGKAAGSVAQVGGGGGDALSAGARKEMAAVLSTSDAVMLRDRLRSLDLPEDVVREIVTARIARHYAALRGKIEEAAEQAKVKQPYWRQRDSYLWEDNHTAEQASELRRLAREEESQIRAVLGRDGEVPSQAQIMYSYLPADKAEQYRDMEYDYHDMRRRLEREMAGFRMPGDAAALRLLDDEYKRDVDAMLTPDEKMAHDLRNSPAARKVQGAFSDFDGTEEEYKTILALQNGMYEKYLIRPVYSNWGDSGMSAKERDAAQKEVDAQIKEALGAERYAEYMRAQREDYRSLQDAARRFNLGADTVAQTYQVREYAASEAARISGDASMSAGEKNEAYAALAGQAAGQIRAALGDEVGNAYINNALPWLKKLPGGGKVEIDAKGNVKVTPAK